LDPDDKPFFNVLSHSDYRKKFNALLSPLGASLFSGILEGGLIEWRAYLKLSRNER